MLAARCLINAGLRRRAGTVAAVRCVSSTPTSSGSDGSSGADMCSKAAMDVHTHMYLPYYMEIMRKRSSVPMVREIEGEQRLILLPGEAEEETTAAGRPIGDEYFSVQRKIQFMDRHGIATSVLSLANPWLDFMAPAEAVAAAQELNDEMERICEDSRGRLLGMAVLPTQDPAGAVAEVERVKRGLPHVRGVIMGTSGAGKGLDDPAMEPVWSAIADNGLVTFIHPHYGVGNEHYGDYGHSLFLALGFPFETTMAISRFILSGVFDRIPHLKLLLAHSGGTLPYLAGRLDSCVAHDPACADLLQKAPSEYLKDLYYDATIYHGTGLRAVIDFVGADRIMFGTDNPFFPPISGNIWDEDWHSVTSNYSAIGELPADATQAAILRDNARRIFGE